MKNVVPTLNLLVPMFFGSAFVVAGLVVVINFSELATLTCQRVQLTQGSCLFVHSRLLRSDEKTMPLNQLQGAKVDVKIDTKRRSSYRLVLLTDGGEVPFTTTFISGAEDANRINAFIANPGEISLRVQQDDRWFAYIFGGICILFGGRVVKFGIGNRA
jgi:hypothetical protein